MFIYEVTITLLKSVQTDWLEWMLTKHIPDIMKSGYFDDVKAFQIIEPTEYEKKVSFTAHYYCKSMEAYKEYREKHSDNFAAEHARRFEGEFSIERRVLAPLKDPEGKVVF
jgi:hypothetical protein